MARIIADLRTLFAVLSGPDPGDALSAPIAPQNFALKNLRGLRVGVLETTALGAHTPEIAAAIQTATAALTQCGFQLQTFQIPELPQALELWWFFFGPAVAHLFSQSITPSQQSQLSPQFREYLAAAEADPAPTLDSLLANCAERDRLRARILHRMAEVPMLLAPVSNTPAFRHHQGTWQGPEGYRETMRPAQWLNLVGFPALSLPINISVQGLPIGVQLIARPNEEDLLLEVAAQLEQARGPYPHPKL
jgi:Asp-tRNA(Asn)/Glu-tRNA(Gln) amidotransferase A subunit family amidase